MKIYIDKNFKCHVTNDGTMTAIETSFFDGKCNAFIEGYRYIPSGESWTREDDIVFTGEMIAPWKPYNELGAAQRMYERQLLKEYETNIAEYEEELAMLDAALLDAQYNILTGGL